MYELTLQVQPKGTNKLVERVTVNSPYMHDKIAEFIRLVGAWNFQGGDRYYNAFWLKDTLKKCSNGLALLADMGLELHMRKQVIEVYNLLEEILIEMDRLRKEIEETGICVDSFLCWEYC